MNTGHFIQFIDEYVLFFFQSVHHPFLDQFFWYVSEAWIFLPLWLWALVKIYHQYHKKDYAKIILIIGATILISDQACNLPKNYFKRLRPTHNQLYQDKIQLVNNYRGGTYGFYSAHASNSAAIFVLVLLFIKNSNLKFWLILYPLLTGISRLYLGVHYFTDVLVGWIAGSIIAFCVYSLGLYFTGLKNRLHT
ncbi:MAG: phosphatase PAP2 family protein [Bacteroidia bacterium]|nr:phosphatase PAP2 family protein [Bacteroidia bacterium]